MRSRRLINHRHTSISFSMNLCHRHLAGESPPTNGVGWLLGTTPPDVGGIMGTSPRLSGTSPRARGSYGSSPSSRLGSSSTSQHKIQHPSHLLLETNGFKQQTYTAYRDRCLKERAEMGEAMDCPLGYWGNVSRSGECENCIA